MVITGYPSPFNSRGCRVTFELPFVVVCIWMGARWWQVCQHSMCCFASLMYGWHGNVSGMLFYEWWTWVSGGLGCSCTLFFGSQSFGHFTSMVREQRWESVGYQLAMPIELGKGINSKAGSICASAMFIYWCQWPKLISNFFYWGLLESPPSTSGSATVCGISKVLVFPLLFILADIF